ncbi:hypothetical protein PAJ34TS1_19550 [Paenibacillus azoreducens]
MLNPNTLRGPQKTCKFLTNSLRIPIYLDSQAVFPLAILLLSDQIAELHFIFVQAYKKIDKFHKKI